MKHPGLNELIGQAFGEKPGARIQGHISCCKDCSHKLDVIRAGIGAGLESGQKDMSLDCKTFDPEIIAEYYEGILTGKVKKSFEAHLLSCPVCFSAWRGLVEDTIRFNNWKKTVKKESLIRSIRILLKETGLLLKESVASTTFRPIFAPASRGLKKEKPFPAGMEIRDNLGKNRTKIMLDHLSKREVRIRIESSTGRRISLQKDRTEILAKLFASVNHNRTDNVLVGNIGKGSYHIFIDGKERFKIVLE